MQKHSRIIVPLLAFFLGILVSGTAFLLLRPSSARVIESQPGWIEVHTPEGNIYEFQPSDGYIYSVFHDLLE